MLPKIAQPNLVNLSATLISAGNLLPNLPLANVGGQISYYLSTISIKQYPPNTGYITGSLAMLSEFRKISYVTLHFVMVKLSS